MRQTLPPSSPDCRPSALAQGRPSPERSPPPALKAALWRLLSGGKLGAPAKRQVVLGGFVADFAVPAARLVIEVDGPCHARQRARDARSTRAHMGATHAHPTK